jgi:hypothetical protein
MRRLSGFVLGRGALPLLLPFYLCFSGSDRRKSLV